MVGSGNLEVHILARLWQLEVPVEELASDYPYLSKGEILDALSYYCDHQAEVDALIAGNRVPEELSASAG